MSLVPHLLAAYRQGLFPMASARDSGPEDVAFYDASVRAIIPLEPGATPAPSRSLRAKINRRVFTITADRDFPAVIRACADTPRPPVEGEPNTPWINDSIIAAYTALHHAGHAHSLEAWLPNPADPVRPRLVGGLYGVHIASAFFGESMFSRPDLGGSDASKVCFHHLLAHLRASGFSLLDTQFINPHTARLGAIEIPRREYHRRLARALDKPATWRPFPPAPA